MYHHILLCTHGTPGAQHAEKWVFEKLLPLCRGAKLSILTVINQDWSVMTGDDWLNSSATRNAFRRHIDDQLAEEIDADWRRIKRTYPQAQEAGFKRIFGPVEQTFAEAAHKWNCDLIVVGPFQKKQGKGFKARVHNKVLHPLLHVPLMVAPGALHDHD